MVQELIIFKKAYEFSKWLFNHTNKFPRSHRFSVAVKIENCMLEKCQIRPVEKGLRFLGQTIFPDRRILPKNNIRRFMKRMKRFQRMYAAGEISLDIIGHSLESWLGHAKQAHTFALRESLLNKLHFQKKGRY